MRKRQFLVIIERDEDGILVGNVPSLRGCHTQAKTLPALISRIKEAIHLCIESERSPAKPLEFVGLQEVEIS